MAETSMIEWTDATWNPITGCSVVSPGCTHCYAMTLAGGRLKNLPSRQRLTRPSKAGPVWTGEVRFNADALDQPLRWRRPRMIFVCAHGDLFHESVPDAWIDQVFAVMALAPQHTFQVLTKRSARMRAYLCALDAEPHRDTVRRFAAAIEAARLPVPDDFVLPLPNVWLGVSVEDQARADERVPDLLQAPAAVRFVSAEPLLGAVDLTHIWFRGERGGMEDWDALDLHREQADDPASVAGAILDWVICGGESGPKARPMHPAWARSLRDQCAAAGVPFFFKQWGAWARWRPGLPAEVKHVSARDGRMFNWPAGIKEPGGPRADTDPMVKVGKKAAGRILDGVVHDGMPGGAPLGGRGPMAAGLDGPRAGGAGGADALAGREGGQP